MKGAARLGLIFSILLSCVACDRVVKDFAERRLASSAPIEWLGGVVRFQLTENHGAFLSLGADLPHRVRFLIFVALTAVALAGCLIALLRNRRWPTEILVGLSLVVGGGTGNLIDRLTRGGSVVDYVSVGVGPLRTGIFNLADVAITCGAILLFFISFRQPAETEEGSLANASEPPPSLPQP